MKMFKKVLPFVIAALLIGLFAMSAYAADTTTATPAPGIGSTPAADSPYIGSQACKGCHKSIYEKFATSVHGNFVKDVVADPTGLGGDFKDNWDKVIGFKASDVQFALLSKPGLADVQELVGKKGTFGVASDEYPVLWASWNFAEEKWVIEPAGYGKGEPWLLQCAGCHVAGLKVPTKANPSVKRSFELAGITCENCHGPARKHATSMGAEPLAKDFNAQNCGQCHNTGSQAKALRPDTGNPFGYPYNDTEGAYVPGQPLDKWLTIAKPDNAKVFWPTGQIKNTHHAQYPEYVTSKHAVALTDLKKNGHANDACLECHSADYYIAKENGEKKLPTLKTATDGVSCQLCHDSHNPTELRKPKAQVCTQCHNGEGVFVAGQAAHHPQKEIAEGKVGLGFAVAPSLHQALGVTCADCHMPGTAVSEGTVRHSHLMKVTLPKDGKKYGMPNSCSGCHPKASVDWLQAKIDGYQKNVTTKLATANKLLTAKKAFAANANYKLAQTQISIVDADGSKGFHNPTLANRLLDNAIAKLNALKAPVKKK